MENEIERQWDFSVEIHFEIHKYIYMHIICKNKIQYCIHCEYFD